MKRLSFDAFSNMAPVAVGGPDHGGPAMGRRGFLAGSAAAICAVPLAPALAAVSMPRDRIFRIFRKGEEIGVHQVTFEQSGNRLVSRIHVDIAVKVAFFTAFRFTQEAEDHWQDGLLVQSRVHTDDDGEITRLEAREGQGRLNVEGPKGVISAPLGTMTDACFWNMDIVGASQLIAAGRGDLAPIEVLRHGEERLEIGKDALRARRFEVSSAIGRSGDIWYDENGHWVQSTIRTRGEILEYRLVV